MKACPYCHAVHNATTGINHDGSMPEQGDYSLCFDCGSFAVFDENGGLRIPEPEQLREIHADPAMRKLLRAWRHVKGGVLS